PALDLVAQGDDFRQHFTIDALDVAEVQHPLPALALVHQVEQLLAHGFHRGFLENAGDGKPHDGHLAHFLDGKPAVLRLRLHGETPLLSGPAGKSHSSTPLIRYPSAHPRKGATGSEQVEACLRAVMMIKNRHRRVEGYAGLTKGTYSSPDDVVWIFSSG